MQHSMQSQAIRIPNAFAALTCREAVSKVLRKFRVITKKNGGISRVKYLGRRGIRGQSTASQLAVACFHNNAFTACHATNKSSINNLGTADRFVQGSQNIEPN